jgi:hypothetical protein
VDAKNRMSIDERFGEWLTREKGFSAKAVSDAKSRSKRVESITGADLDVTIVSEQRLLKMLDRLARQLRNDLDRFVARRTYSQLMYSVRLYADFKGYSHNAGALKKYSKRQRWTDS